MFKKAITFDDIILQPQYSNIDSRMDVDLKTKLGNIHLSIPILSANMDSVTEDKMANAMANSGGLGVLHRYATKEQVKAWMLNIPWHLRVPSVGVQTKDLENAVFYLEFTKRICVDIAHGDSSHMIDMVKNLVKLGYKDIIAGNVTTASAAHRLADAGANIIKVGVGPGSVCTTRIVTGHGVPQITAILNVKEGIENGGHNHVSIVADGGIRSSGDIVKALAVGADAVMLGSMLAGTYESPSAESGTYRGMASEEAQMSFRGKVNNYAAEGVSAKVHAKGPVSTVISNICGGIRSGLSYSGARNIRELRENCEILEMTSNGLKESHPHF
jgi:IMP dehydrogenase